MPISCSFCALHARVPWNGDSFSQAGDPSKGKSGEAKAPLMVTRTLIRAFEGRSGAVGRLECSLSGPCLHLLGVMAGAADAKGMG